MPKIKTHSGAKKRFKMSKNGKPMRAHANKSHILPRRAQREREISARLPLQILQTASRLSVLFPINNPAPLKGDYSTNGGKEKWHELKVR